MDFEFFEQLTADEARTYLDRYLEVESKAVDESVREAQADGVLADFSVESIPSFFSWLLTFIKPVVREPDAEMPEWMRIAHESVGGFIGFADESGPLVLRGSYYLGESFVRSYSNLSWNLGRPRTATHHMPNVVGFSNGVPMATILIVENMVGRALGNPAGSNFEEVVKTWNQNV